MIEALRRLAGGAASSDPRIQSVVLFGSLAMDIFPLTIAEIERRTTPNDPFLRRMQREGVELYARRSHIRIKSGLP